MLLKSIVKISGKFGNIYKTKLIGKQWKDFFRINFVSQPSIKIKKKLQGNTRTFVGNAWQNVF